MVLPVWILGINSRNATVFGGNKFNVAPAQWACVTSSFSQSEPQHNSKESLEGHIWDKSLALEHSTGICMVHLMSCGSFLGWIVFAPRIHKGQHINGWCLCPLRRFHRDSSSDLTPAYQPPVLVDPENRGSLPIYAIYVCILLIISNMHLLERAIFSSTSVQTGVVKAILAKSAFTAITRPPVEREPMLTIKTWHKRDAIKNCSVEESSPHSLPTSAPWHLSCHPRF